MGTLRGTPHDCRTQACDDMLTRAVSREPAFTRRTLQYSGTIIDADLPGRGLTLQADFNVFAFETSDLSQVTSQGLRGV